MEEWRHRKGRKDDLCVSPFSIYMQTSSWTQPRVMPFSSVLMLVCQRVCMCLYSNLSPSSVHRRPWAIHASEYFRPLCSTQTPTLHPPQFSGPSVYTISG